MSFRSERPRLRVHHHEELESRALLAGHSFGAAFASPPSALFAKAAPTPQIFAQLIRRQSGRGFHCRSFVRGLRHHADRHAH